MRSLVISACLVIAVLGSYTVRRGAVVQDHGPSAILNEYVLIKLISSWILEDEKGLVPLYKALQNMKATFGTVGRVAARLDQITKMVEGELPAVVAGKPRQKRALLPFVGTALKGLFGVSTTKDAARARESLNKLEQWASQHGNAINSIIGGVNENSRTIQKLAGEVDSTLHHTFRSLRCGKKGVFK